jgi:hypothetical protein
MSGLSEVNVEQLRLSITDLLQAAGEGSTLTHSWVDCTGNEPMTNITVVEFKEEPEEIAEFLRTDPVIQNRVLNSMQIVDE